MSDAGKEKKPSFFRRLVRRGQEFLRLGSVLVNEPSAFPRELSALFRRFIRTIWDARGGGFYACGVAVSFLWLEFSTFFNDVLGADSVGGFVGEQLMESIFRFLGASIVNGWLALIWPVYVLEWRQPWGIVAVVAAYAVFALFLKQAIEQWLVGDRDATPPD